MAKKTMSVDDVMANGKEVQTFDKFEKKISSLSTSKAGRPKKSEATKVKLRALYYTDEEFDEITRIADTYGMSATNYMKFCIKKKMSEDKA